MHITGMAIADFSPFTDRVEVEFDDHVNVLVGPNASGKSTILRALQYRIEFEDRFEFQLSDDWTREGTRRQRWNRGSRESRADNKKDFSDLIPWIYFPATRLNLPLTYDTDGMQGLQSSDPVFLEEEGDEIEPDPLESMRSRLSAFRFDGTSVHRYQKGMTDLVRAGRRDPQAVRRIQSVKETAYSCVQSICSDVLVSGRTPGDFIYHQPVGEHELSITNVHDDMGIKTVDPNTGFVFLGDLSSGTQGTLLWIWHLAIELANSHSPRRGRRWHEQPAILLLDEIENHLHPTWQRRVIPALLKHFPGLQIFATTHSPFVVAGLKAGQVHLLNRDENGVVTTTTNTEDIVGWTADEILRTMMGVDDPTDDETARNAAELRRLRDEGERADEREEELRQKRMQELRRLVDRDLLAGGPMARRREEFSQRFREAMERRRREDELNQDNG